MQKKKKHNVNNGDFIRVAKRHFIMPCLIFILYTANFIAAINAHLMCTSKLISLKLTSVQKAKIYFKIKKKTKNKIRTIKTSIYNPIRTSNIQH